MTSSVTSLEFDGSIPYSSILPSLVLLSQSLKSLTLTIPAAYDAEHPELTFDSLDDLYLKIEAYSVSWVSRWRIPHLRRLWLRSHYLIQRQTTEILDAYGRGITFLQLSESGSYLQEALDKCPALEYLILYERPTFATHQTIKFIDVFNPIEDPPFDKGDSLTEEPPSVITVASLKDAFPALQACRNLNIRMSYFQCLPPPLSEVENEFQGHGGADEGDNESVDDGKEEDDQDSEVEQDGDASDVEEDEDVDMQEELAAYEVVTVVREFTNPNSVNGGAWARCDRSDDYVFNAEDDDGGSDTSDSDSGGGSVGQDEFNMEENWEENWEVHHDEALSMYYLTD